MNSSIGKTFESFLDSLSSSDTSNDDKDISFQIFYDIAKIRIAQFRYKKSFHRKRDFSLADIFQDILAHYLKNHLGEGFKVVLEEGKKPRPDILIKKNDQNWAIIEAKTNLSWVRPLVKDSKYKERLELLSNEFDIPLDRVFYVTEYAKGVSKEFEEIMKNDKNEAEEAAEIKKFIIPLFIWTIQPHYLIKEKMIETIADLTDERIKEFYKGFKLTDFKEKILDRIKSES